MMNWKGIRRKLSWPERGNLLASSWTEIGISPTISIRIGEIRNRNVLNACQSRTSSIVCTTNSVTFWFMCPTKFVLNLTVYLQVINLFRFCNEVVHLCSSDLLNVLTFTCKYYTELYFGVFHGISWLIDGSLQKELEIMCPGRKYMNLQSKRKNMSGRRKDSLCDNRVAGSSAKGRFVVQWQHSVLWLHSSKISLNIITFT